MKAYNDSMAHIFRCKGLVLRKFDTLNHYHMLWTLQLTHFKI